MVFAGVGAGEEFFAGEDGVGPREEAEGLGFVGHFGASGGEADHRAGHEDAREGDGADEFEGLDGRGVFERGAGGADEHVDGDAFGMRILGGELEE